MDRASAEGSLSASPGDARPEPEPEVEPEREPQATPAAEEGEQGYTTKDKDTFNDVCEALEIDRAEQRVYFDWLKNSHRMGNDKRTCTKLFFPNPIGKVNKITKFNGGVYFPAPTGEDWESHRRQYEIRNGSIQPMANSVLEGNVTAILAAQARRLEEYAYRVQREYTMVVLQKRTDTGHEAPYARCQPLPPSQAGRH